MPQAFAVLQWGDYRQGDPRGMFRCGGLAENVTMPFGAKLAGMVGLASFAVSFPPLQVWRKFRGRSRSVSVRGLGIKMVPPPVDRRFAGSRNTGDILYAWYRLQQSLL
jgi:hypothetical protein